MGKKEKKVMWFRHWARRRYLDWDTYMHADWTFKIHQFAYKRMPLGSSNEYQIMVRARKGWFGATYWTRLAQVKTQEDCCNILQAMVDDYDESSMKDMLDVRAEAGKSKADARKLVQYCGYSIDGILK